MEYLAEWTPCVGIELRLAEVQKCDDPDCRCKADETPRAFVIWLRPVELEDRWIAFADVTAPPDAPNEEVVTDATKMGPGEIAWMRTFFRATAICVGQPWPDNPKKAWGIAKATMTAIHAMTPEETMAMVSMSDEELGKAKDLADRLADQLVAAPFN